MPFLPFSCDHNTYHIRFRDTWLQREKEATRPFTFQAKAPEMAKNQYKSELLIRSHRGGRGFESLRVHHIINPQKCGFFLYSCGFSAFLSYANLAVSCGLFAYRLHRNYTVKCPLPCVGTSVAPWRNFYMARLGGGLCISLSPPKTTSRFPGEMRYN